MRATNTKLARACRNEEPISAGRGSLAAISGMRAVERRRADGSNAGTCNGNLRSFHENSRIRTLLHSPHFVDVDFFDEPPHRKPVIQAWVLASKEQLVLISGRPILIGNNAVFHSPVKLRTFDWKCDRRSYHIRPCLFQEVDRHP